MKTSKEDILNAINQIKKDNAFYAEQLVDPKTHDQLWINECLRQCSMAQQEILAWQFVLSVYDDVKE